MTARDTIGELGYFARKINFAAGRDEPCSIEEGEHIPISTVRHTLAGKADRHLAASKRWPVILPQLKRESLRPVKLRMPTGV